MSAGRVDVHAHLVPPFWAKELIDHGGNPSAWGAPVWSPEQLLGFMDEEEAPVSRAGKAPTGSRSRVA